MAKMPHRLRTEKKSCFALLRDSLPKSVEPAALLLPSCSTRVASKLAFCAPISLCRAERRRGRCCQLAALMHVLLHPNTSCVRVPMHATAAAAMTLCV